MGHINIMIKNISTYSRFYIYVCLFVYLSIAKGAYAVKLRIVVTPCGEFLKTRLENEGNFLSVKNKLLFYLGVFNKGVFFVLECIKLHTNDIYAVLYE